jgi:hypothetical protein
MVALTSALIKQIESLGYAVSVFRNPGSLLGSVGPFVEMHAVKLADPEQQHIARVEGDNDEDVYRAACLLAQMVEIELEDG